MGRARSLRTGGTGPAGVVLLVLVLCLGAGLSLASGPHVVAAPHGRLLGSPAAMERSAPRAPPPFYPPHRPLISPSPLSGPVDPYAFFQSEPTSLGVTDYGVNAAGGGYSYSTPIWWADANITRLLAYYPSEAEGNGDVTLQLNVVLRLISPSDTQYAYWIQDVVSVDTISKQISYEDNVWNLSASGSIASGTISGNGSVYTYKSQNFYADAPICQGSSGGSPGDCVTLHYPAVVTVRVTTGRFGGVPHVSFQYQYAGNWLTFDNVSFPFAGNYADNDFTVDGTQYTPWGLFYDAEWDYTGPGGEMEDRNSSLAMQLERWNAHDLQAPPNAFNFGSDTGESIFNVVSSAELNTTNGTVGASVRSGGGSLGALYYGSDVATLNVTTPAVADGTITIGGEPHPFVGQNAVFTVAPGAYNVSLWAGLTFVASALPTLAKGTTTDLILGYPAPYLVTFIEQGLPGTAAWSLSVDGIAYPDPGPDFALELTNGTHNYTVSPVPGYTTSVYRGTFPVAGGPVTLYVNFSAFLLPVEFSESGLPAGVEWTVTLSTSSQTAQGASVAFNEPNGTFPFSVTAGLSYLADPSSSAVVVAGQPVLQSIAFSLQPGFLTGQVSPANASLSVGGSAEATDHGAFNLSLLPGVYTVEVSAPGFVTWWTNVTIAPTIATPLGVTLNQSAPRGGGPGAPNSGAGGPLTATDTVLIVGVAAVVAVAVIGAALYAARRRGR